MPCSGSEGGPPLGARLALFVLLLLAPFEPRAPLLLVAGSGLSLLEAAAALGCLVLAWSARNRIVPLLRRPALPLLALTGYALAQLLSGAVSADHRVLALKFALRMAALAAFAWLVAAQPLPVRRAGLFALVAGGALVAALAIAEGLGMRGLDPFLGLFREAPLNVGGVRRATAGTEYPNLAAGFLMYGLLASAGLLSSRARSWRWAWAPAALLSLGLLFTYSRGALAAAALGLVAMAWLGRSGAAGLASLAALASVTAGFLVSGEAFRLRLASEGTAGWYGARYAPEERELALAPGERSSTRVTVTNTGSKAWVVSEAFHLASHWYDEAGRPYRWDGGRTPLPRDLAPGESVPLDALVEAPSVEGRFLLVWDMVHEDTTWFSETGVPTEPVAVRVSRAARASAPPALAPPATREPPWRPSRFELWRLALSLWRRSPLVGVGPDNYRRLYGPEAGRTSWDDRVFANNTLLEAAATTGLVGLSALGLALGSLLVRAGRRARQAPVGSVSQGASAALFGLAVGLVAHGLVDYVLAFTGHYLVFGFVVGAVSARDAGES